MIKNILLILAFIAAIAILNSMQSDLEVMQQCFIDDNLNRIEAAKRYQLEQYIK